MKTLSWVLLGTKGVNLLQMVSKSMGVLTKTNLDIVPYTYEVAAENIW